MLVIRKADTSDWVWEPVKNVLADFSVKGVPPPHPLNGKSFAKKPLAERGGAPPPLNGKNPLKRF